MQRDLALREGCGCFDLEWKPSHGRLIGVCGPQDERPFSLARGQVPDERDERQRPDVARKGLGGQDLHDVVKREIARFVGFDAAADKQGMHDRQRISGHGSGLYPRCVRAGALAVVLALLAYAPRPVSAEDWIPLSSGRPKPFEVKGAGGSQTFRFVAISGCRYRLTAEPGTLPRPVLSIGHWKSDPFARADALENGKPVTYVFACEKDGRMTVVVTGFSAQTGTGTIRLDTLGPDDKPTKAHRRILSVRLAERALVGNLLIGESNTWDLEVKPDTAYQITPTVGSAGRVRLRVLLADGVEIGDSEVSALAERPHPPVRFRAPALEEGQSELPAIRLEVRGGFDGGGDYGLRMRVLKAGETVAPVGKDRPPPPPAEQLEGAMPTFRAGPGDLALLYVPDATQNPHRVQLLRGKAWMNVTNRGQGASARTHQWRGMNWFRPFSPGTFRFAGARGFTPPDAQLQLFRRKDLGGAPIHLGTGVDPEVRVRVHKKWTLAGLGACMPGWDYLFVAVGAPRNGVAMRVVGPDGKTVAKRGYSGSKFVPDTGPSLRFQPKQPGLFRLEIRSTKKRVVAALLRHASN